VPGKIVLPPLLRDLSRRTLVTDETTAGIRITPSYTTLTAIASVA